MPADCSVKCLDNHSCNVYACLLIEPTGSSPPYLFTSAPALTQLPAQSSVSIIALAMYALFYPLCQLVYLFLIFLLQHHH